MSLISSIVIRAVSPLIEKQITEKQSESIAKHNEKGFIEGATIQSFRGPQKGRRGIIKEVKHLWLIVEDSEGDRFRLLVVNCKVLPKEVKTMSLDEE